MAGRRGDNFTGNSLARTLVNPDEPRWSDQIIYLLKTLTGQDTPDKDQFVIATKSAALGDRSNAPATVGNISQASLIALNKGILILLSGIESAIAALSVLISAEFNETQIDIQTVTAAIASLETVLSPVPAILEDIRDILQAKTQGASISGTGSITLPITGPIYWLSWDFDGPTAALTIVNGVNIVLESFSPGFYQFPRPLDCTSAIVVGPPGSSLTLSAGV